MKSHKKFLDALVKEYSKKIYIQSDPIEFCYRYENKKDIEIIGFISALFSYGNVPSIKKHLEELLLLFGKSPFTSIQEGNFEALEHKIPKYRFQTSKDILIFLKALSTILQTEKSLEKLFRIENNTGLLNERIVNFQKHFTLIAQKIVNQTKLSNGLSFLIGSGILGSSHKRYCMFLRWMVRDSFPDFGIYHTISKTELIFPTDVHIVRLSHILGISNRRTVDFKLARIISDYFKSINPQDPLQYDFALSRLGILKICKAKYIPEICEVCELKKLCKVYND